MDSNTSITSGKQQDEISLKDVILKIQAWWRYIVSKWIVILIAGIVGGTVGLIYAFTQKPLYKAELSFALADEKGGGGLSVAAGLASQFGIDLGAGSAGGEFSGDNLLVLMESRSIVEKTLLSPVSINGKVQTFADYYIEYNNLREKWDGKPELQNVHFLPNADRAKFTLKQDSLLGAFFSALIKDNLSVDKVDKKLSIITVRVNSTNELFSKFFVEALAKVTSDFYIQTRTGKAYKNVAILKRQTDSVRTILYGAISGVAASTDFNPNPNPLLSTLRVPSQRKQVDVQANSAILTELVKNLEIAKMNLLQETPLIQVIDKPILPLEKLRVSKIKSIVLGGILGALLIILSLSVKRFYKRIISNES